MRQVVDVSQFSVSSNALQLSIDEARALAVELAESTSSERIPTAAAHGRILREQAITTEDFPRFDNSAMDGWAVAEARPGSFRVVGESRAGAPYLDVLAAGEAARISTGAALPAGAVAVVPIESATESDNLLTLTQPVLSGQHIRPSGRHAHARSEVASGGTKLGAGEIAAIAAAGIGEVAVAATPKVAIVYGGDELVQPGEAAPHGAVFDSNSPMLTALLDAAGCTVVSTTSVADDAAAVTDAIDQAIAQADLVITTGGVSVGAHDYVMRAIDALGGDLLTSGTHARPGRRMAIARFSGADRATVMFSLPGNPLSSWVSYQLYVRRSVRAMLGQAMPPIFEAELGHSVPRSPNGARVLVGRTATYLGKRRFQPRDTQSDNTLALVSTNALATIDSGGSVAHKGIFVECEKVDV